MLTTFLGCQKGVAPKIYGCTKSHRLEEFIDGSILKSTQLVENYDKFRIVYTFASVLGLTFEKHLLLTTDS